MHPGGVSVNTQRYPRQGNPPFVDLFGLRAGTSRRFAFPILILRPVRFRFQGKVAARSDYRFHRKWVMRSWIISTQWPTTGTK